MALGFPNRSRSYDARRNLIRFWGHDSALEISFFVEVAALRKLCSQTMDDEAAYLAAFETVRDRIHDAARSAYSRTQKDVYLLAATDF